MPVNDECFFDFLSTISANPGRQEDKTRIPDGWRVIAFSFLASWSIESNLCLLELYINLTKISMPPVWYANG